MSDYTVIIPARFASTRLPGKPLKDINGKSMVQRVYEQASLSNAKSVIVATDDDRIAQVVKGFGGDFVMTRADHLSGTDRLQEVASVLKLDNDDVVVNVQGDEPLIPPEVIDQVAGNLLADKSYSAATLSEPITRAKDFLNPNIVKVVSSEQHRALYFSRASIPWPRDQFAVQQDSLPVGFPAQRHIGIYAYRVDLLNYFVTWKPGVLEGFESLEQLRMIENGHAIHVEPACAEVPGGVDTQFDLDNVRALLTSAQG